MFSISNLLNNLDNAAKETLEEDKPQVSAQAIRMQRKGLSKSTPSAHSSSEAIVLDVERSDHEVAAISSSVDAAALVHSNQETRAAHSMSVLSTPLAQVQTQMPPPSHAHKRTQQTSAEAHDRTVIKTPLALAPLPPPSSSTSSHKPHSISGQVHTGSVLELEEEIERLNGECLELEDNVAALRAGKVFP